MPHPADDGARVLLGIIDTTPAVIGRAIHCAMHA
jgi:hypothetical protein